VSVRASGEHRGTDPALTGRRLVHVTTADLSLVLLLGPQLRAFADAGMDVIGMSAPGPYVDQLEAWGVRHVPLRHATRAVAPGSDARALAELAHHFRCLRPDLVHTHNPKPGIYGRLAARAVGVPGIVNTVHGLYATPEDPVARRALVYALERLAAACSHAELVQNPEDLAVLRRLGVPEDRLVLLGNGVDLGRFQPPRSPDERARARQALGVPGDAVVVGTVGRLVWQKGFRELFEAARLLAARRPQVRFVVVGPTDPAKADALDDDDLAEARRSGNVVFTGGRDDVDQLYAGFDLFVLPSYREGFPRSAMEAAASGLPVIATDIRGCRQAVDHEVTGLLVPLRDASALADAVTRLADSEADRRRMGEAAAAKARAEFDDRAVVATTLAVYERVLARATSRTSRRMRSSAAEGR
jgi:glycosyltransferase involved in cell wall biosynthesis